MNIPKLFLELRKATGLSQVDFAARYKVSSKAYCRYESGAREPKASLIFKIMRDHYPAFDAHISALYTYKPRGKKYVELPTVTILAAGKKWGDDRA